MLAASHEVSVNEVRPVLRPLTPEGVPNVTLGNVGSPRGIREPPPAQLSSRTAPNSPPDRALLCATLKDARSCKRPSAGHESEPTSRKFKGASSEALTIR